MVSTTFSLLLGLALLVAGGELLVRGATKLAALLRISPVIVGLTIVAMGTSAPELVVSVQAALDGSPAVAIGNVVGSNIFNIAFILGLAALVSPLRVAGSSVRVEWPVMFAAACITHLLARDGTLDRLEGGFLLASMLVFVVFLIVVARKAPNEAETEQFASVQPQVERTISAWVAWSLAIAGGVAVLVVGADVFVASATTLASSMGVPNRVIAVTLVAAGTSLPELFTSLVASVRGNDDIAVTNILGSNIFNALGILGTTALIEPIPVDSSLVAVDDWWMLAVSALLLPLMLTKSRVSRQEGFVMLVVYAAYAAATISSY